MNSLNLLRNKYYISNGLCELSVWIQLIFAKTENWKYCNKIIFKYVNSIMNPWTVHKQCPLSLVQCSNVMLLFTNSAFVHYIVLTCDITVHLLKKKKKKRQTWVWKHGSKPTQIVTGLLDKPSSIYVWRLHLKKKN